MIDFMGRKTSYGEMWRTIRRVARGLQDMGVRKGDRVGLYLPNVPHYVAASYGAMMAGAIVVNYSPLHTAADLAHPVEDRSEERRVGEGWVSKCRYRGCP